MADEMAGAVLEAPVESAQSGEPTTENTLEQSSQEQNSQQESSQSAERTDNRQQPDAIRKTLKSLTENPETKAAGEEFRKALNERKSYKQFFPSVGEARQTRQALDAIGGVAKLPELQSYASNMREVDEMLEAGDPRVVDKILETGPRGIVKILPALLEKLAEADGQGIGAAMQPHALKFMDSEGLPEALDAMVAVFNAQSGTPEQKLAEIKRVLAGMTNWYRGLGQKQQKADPEREQFQNERQQWEQQKYLESVSQTFDGPNGVLPYAQAKIMARLKGDAQKLGVDAELTDIWLKDIWKVIENKRNADDFFKADRDSKYNERTRKVASDAVQWMNGFTDKYFDDAYQKVMGPRLKAAQTRVPVKAAPTVAPHATTAAIDVAETLKRAGSRDGMRDMILQGKAFARGGKAIKKVSGHWQFS